MHPVQTKGKHKQMITITQFKYVLFTNSKKIASQLICFTDMLKMIKLSCHHELFAVEGFDQRHLSGVS